MNTGAFGEGFPYSNFHDLNMDWIIKIAKDFLDQYTNIQTIITDGVDTLNATATEMEELLQQWYDTHSDDIPNQLALALQTLANDLATTKNNLDVYSAQKLADTLESIPADYTDLYNMAVRDGKKIDNDESKLIALQRNRTAYISTDGMILYRTGYAMDDDGTLVELPSHDILLIRDRTIKSLTFPAMDTNISMYPTCVVKYGDTVRRAYTWNTTQETTIDMPDTTFDAIYLNLWNASTTPKYDHVNADYNQGLASIQNLKTGFGIECKPWAIPYGETVTYKFKDLPELLPGYISSGDPNGSGAHKHILFPACGVKSISLTSTASAGVAWAVYYPALDRTGTNIIGSGTGGTFNFDKPFIGYIGLNRFENDNNTYAEEFSITYWNKEDVMPQMKYKTSVRKPFSFNGKTAIFIGDSITQGYTQAGSITENNFPKLFSQAVGLTYTVNASAGSCYASGANDVPTIPTKVANIDTSNPPDFVFIAGGVNDWQLNVGKTSFVGAITNMCTWINNNLPNTKIIFITPINACEQAWRNSHDDLVGVGHLKTYSDWIYETVKSKDNGNYSVICGFEFGFPSDGYDSAYISAMSGDNLHPTERGYADLYTVGLLTALQ